MQLRLRVNQSVVNLRDALDLGERLASRPRRFLQLLLICAKETHHHTRTAERRSVRRHRRGAEDLHTAVEVLAACFNLIRNLPAGQIRFLIDDDVEADLCLRGLCGKHIARAKHPARGFNTLGLFYRIEDFVRHLFGIRKACVLIIHFHRARKLRRRHIRNKDEAFLECAVDAVTEQHKHKDQHQRLMAQIPGEQPAVAALEAREASALRLRLFDKHHGSHRRHQCHRDDQTGKQ